MSCSCRLPSPGTSKVDETVQPGCIIELMRSACPRRRASSFPTAGQHPILMEAEVETENMRELVRILATPFSLPYLTMRDRINLD